MKARTIFLVGLFSSVVAGILFWSAVYLRAEENERVPDLRRLEFRAVDQIYPLSNYISVLENKKEFFSFHCREFHTDNLDSALILNRLVSSKLKMERQRISTAGKYEFIDRYEIYYDGITVSFDGAKMTEINCTSATNYGVNYDINHKIIPFLDKILNAPLSKE